MECSVLVVVLFVNRQEFPDEDSYERHPRNLNVDIERLRALGYVDALFLPDADEFYHQGKIKGAAVTYNDELAQIYEHHRRPQIFSGLATFMTKLVTTLQPTQVYVGRQCIQTERLLRLLLADLMLNVEVVGVDAVRREDGLLENTRLGAMRPDEVQMAATVFASLKELIGAYLAGETDPAKLVQVARDRLSQVIGLEVEYLAIVDEQTFKEVDAVDRRVGALVVVGVMICDTHHIADNVSLGPCELYRGPFAPVKELLARFRK